MSLREPISISSIFSISVRSTTRSTGWSTNG